MTSPGLFSGRSARGSVGDSTVWPVWRRLGLAYAVMILINVIPPLLMGGLLSIEYVGREEAPPYRRFARILELARHPNAHIKIHGLGESCERPDAPAPGCAPSCRSPVGPGRALVHRLEYDAFHFPGLFTAFDPGVNIP